MILVYVSIPFMILGLAIATGPIIWAMRRERQEQNLATELARVSNFPGDVGRGVVDLESREAV